MLPGVWGSSGAREAVWRAAARLMAEGADTERLADLLARVQGIRASIEEVQGAALHFVALPSRQDVRKLKRRMISLERRVSELELAVTRLERAARGRRARPGEAR